MSHSHCPICSTELQVIDVAPCWDCGHLPRELEELKKEEHTYSVFRVFETHEVVLCDFCDADFGSYLPSYFGLPDTGHVIGDHLEFVRDLPKPWLPTKDKFCPECAHRLKFLNLRQTILDESRRA